MHGSSVKRQQACDFFDARLFAVRFRCCTLDRSNHNRVLIDISASAAAAAAAHTCAVAPIILWQTEGHGETSHLSKRWRRYEKAENWTLIFQGCADEMEALRFEVFVPQANCLGGNEGCCTVADVPPLHTGNLGA